MKPIKLSKEYLAQKIEEARRADRAKAEYAAKHGLHPVTLKPLGEGVGLV